MSALHTVPAMPVANGLTPATTTEVGTPSTTPLTMDQKYAQYAEDMHAYSTLQSDVAKVAAEVAVAQRVLLQTNNSDSSITSTISSAESEESPFPITPVPEVKANPLATKAPVEEKKIQI